MTLNDYQLSVVTSNVGLISQPATAQLVHGKNSVDNSDLSTNFIGFDFNFIREPFSHFVCSPNGWVMLRGNSVEATEDLSDPEFAWGTTNWTPRIFLFPWWSDLKVFGGVHTWLDETVGAEKRVIQWDVYSAKEQTESYYERLVFQLVLSRNGAIEYRYAEPILLGSFSSGAIADYGASIGARLLGTSESDGDFRDFLGTSGTPAGSVGPFNSSYYSEGAKSVDSSVDIHYPGSVSNTTNNAYYFTFATNVMFGTALGPVEMIGKINMLKIKIVSDEDTTEFGSAYFGANPYTD